MKYDLYDRIDNCCSLKWLLQQLRLNIDDYTNEQILRIIEYYESHK